MKKLPVVLVCLAMVMVQFFGTGNAETDEELVESPAILWFPIANQQIEVQVLPGTDHRIIVDQQRGGMYTPFLMIPSECKDALDIVPEWIRKDLELKFIVMEPQMASEMAYMILENEDNETLDEIAFTIAHLSVNTYNNENFFPQLIQHNAELIYAADEIVPYANITERDDYTTIIYQTEDGEIELPRDIYYWFVVHPDIGDEVPTYVDPEYNYAETQSRDRNKGTAPPVGKFWREYFMVFNKTGSPLLPEMLNGTETLLDGIKAINSWISQSMTFTSDDERPIQPVRIYTKGIGRCGEYQDMRSSAARSCLIPVVPTSNSAEDHVWNEFWMDRWIHWDGMIDNPHAYEKGWGKTLSTVWNQRGDGFTWDATENYTETSTISVNVVDQAGLPADGAQVELLTEMFYFEDIKTTTNFATTGPDGKVEFKVGNNRNFWGAVDGGDLGNDPLNPNVLPSEIVMNTSVDEEYEYTFTLPRSADDPQVQDIISSYPDEGNYKVGIDFEVTDHTIRGRNEFTGDTFENRQEGGDITFFITNSQGMQLYNLGSPFQGWQFKERVTNGSTGLILDGEDNWEMVFYNGYSQDTVKTIRYNVTLYGFVRSHIQVTEVPIYELGRDIEILGVTEASIPIEHIDVMIQGETDWISTTIRTFQYVGYTNYRWDAMIESTGMEPGEYTVWSKSVNKSISHYDSINITIVDTTDPSVQIDEMSPEPYFEDSTLQISGIATDNHRVEDIYYYIDDDPTVREDLPFDENGNWSLYIELYALEYGDHTISFMVSDPSGNFDVETIDFNVGESVVPIIDLEGPKDGSLFKIGDDITFSGEASDNIGLDSFSFYVDGRRIADILHTVDEHGSFEYTWSSSSATDGIHEIMFKGVDHSGNEYSEFLDIELDGKAPNLEVFIYGTPSVGPESPFTVAGETDDINEVEFLSWSVDGDEWIDVTDELSGGDFEFDFGEDLDLEEGEFELQISSVDSVGNERIVNKDLYYDPEGPEIDLSSIGRLYMVGDIIPLKVDLSDASGLESVRIEADGIGEIDTYDSSVPGSIDLEIDTEDMVPGDIEIRVFAVDILGNTNEETISTRVVGEMTDSDRDGMPDWWEFKYGLDMNTDDSGYDSDGDGVSNLYEYLGNDKLPGNDDYSDPTSKTSSPSYPEEKGFPIATLILVAGIILVIGAVVLLIVWLTKRG